MPAKPRTLKATAPAPTPEPPKAPILTAWATPGNESTQTRVFRVEVDVPEPEGPALFRGHIQEFAALGASTFRDYRPDLQVAASLASLKTDADADLAAAALQFEEAYKVICHKLYERKYIELTTLGPSEA